jgi:FkbM family methyltransferase
MSLDVPSKRAEAALAQMEISDRLNSTRDREEWRRGAIDLERATQERAFSPPAFASHADLTHRARLRPPYHWKWGVSLRKRALRLRRLSGLARDGQFETCRYFGADFLIQYEGIDPDTYLGSELFLKRYEWLQIPRMIAACERLRPSAFIDAGAHFGLYTCIIGCRRLVPRLIAFEPNPNTIIHLKTHLMMNHILEKVELHECAIGSENGTATLRPGSGPHSARSMIVDSADPGGGYHVPVKPLDELVFINGQTIAIKIDVEYHEMSALKGAERLLSSNRGYAQVEAIKTHEKQAVIARMGDFGWQFAEVINDDVIFEKR